MEWRITKFGIFGKKNDNGIKHLKEGRHYICGNMVFKVREDCVYDRNNPTGASIPYYWLVDLESERHYTNSTLGLPKNQNIFYACDADIRKAENILENKQTSFKNVERLIFESKRNLDEALKMLRKLQIENGQQG
jgi:hypothetical protein